jgi:hypothetical protein
MKRIISSLITIMVLVMPGCEKESSSGNLPLFSGQIVNHSECKYDTKSTSSLSETPDSLSCVEYSFNNDNHKLTLKHINAGFNCCPGNLKLNPTLINDTIIIEESESEPACNCDCIFDLDIEIEGVAAQKYQLLFIEPYVGEQEKLNFEIDLSQRARGSFCVTRKQYPWGLCSVPR